MNRKASSGIMLILLLIATLALAFNTQPTESSESPTLEVSESPPTEWNQTYGGVSDESAFSVVETSDGGYALAGWTESFGAGYNNCPDFWLVKVDSSGNHQWNQTYGGVDWDDAWCGVETSDGGYALAGMTSSFGVGGSDVWLVKLAAEEVVVDVAVTNVSLSKTVVGQGYSVSINVTAENQGDYTENFDITLYANTTIITTYTDITLSSGNSITVTFPWDTTSVAKGNSTIKATATILPEETDIADNTLIDGVVLITFPGDVNGDGKVRIDDILAIALAFGSDLGDPEYEPNLDINGDNKIRVDDILIAALNFGLG